MRSLSLRLCVFIVAAASLALGQVGNGTITGTVTDPANAVVPNATVEAKNAETGVVSTTVTTSAGVYTIPDLPIGTYSITATVPGFKTYTHNNLALAALQTMKEDIALQVGASNESVTVSAEASMLKTESGEISQQHTRSASWTTFLCWRRHRQLGHQRRPQSLQHTADSARHQRLRQQRTIHAQRIRRNHHGNDARRRSGRHVAALRHLRLHADGPAQRGLHSGNRLSDQQLRALNSARPGSVVINMTMKSGTNSYHGTGSITSSTKT